jgi:hypothetical protein
LLVYPLISQIYPRESLLNFEQREYLSVSVSVSCQIPDVNPALSRAAPQCAIVRPSQQDAFVTELLHRQSQIRGRGSPRVPTAQNLRLHFRDPLGRGTWGNVPRDTWMNPSPTRLHHYLPPLRQ